MPGRTEIGIREGPEFRRVANALREIDASLPGEFRRALRRAVKPLADRAKARIRTLPVRGHGHSGLRRRIARGVRIRAAVGRNARVRVVTVMTDMDEAIIPRGFDRPEGWRHPVFGHGSVWQRPLSHGWFIDTFEDGRDDVRDSLRQVLQDAADRIDRAGRGA